MTGNLRRLIVLTGLLSALFVLPGCGHRVSFEKIDYKGHVRIEKDGVGYCYHVPKDWEIREKLEGADVVCLGPLENGFRDSVISASIAKSELGDPAEEMKKELDKLGSRVTVVEPWSGPDKAVVVTLNESKFASEPLVQFLYLHVRSNGSGVLITGTTTKSQMEAKRVMFEDVIQGAHYNLKDCPDVGGIPKVFPTPEVTLSPKPS